MPTYSYRCNECDFQFDKISRMAERNEPKCCPKCGGHDSKVIITQALEICDPVRMGRLKVSDSFNDTLRGIRDANHGSTIELRK